MSQTSPTLVVQLGRMINKQVNILTLFSKTTDLNWENPTVRQEIYKMMKWWLDKVSMARMDVIILSQAKDLPDAPNPNGDKCFSW